MSQKRWGVGAMRILYSHRGGTTLKMQRNNCSSETAETAEEKSKRMLPLVALTCAVLWSLILVFLSYSKPLLPGNRYVEVLLNHMQLNFPTLCLKPYFHFNHRPLRTSWIWLGSMIDLCLKFLRLPWIFPSKIPSIFHSPEMTQLHSPGSDYFVITKCLN